MDMVMEYMSGISDYYKLKIIEAYETCNQKKNSEKKNIMIITVDQHYRICFRIMGQIEHNVLKISIMNLPSVGCILITCRYIHLVHCDAICVFIYRFKRVVMYLWSFVDLNVQEYCPSWVYCI